MAEIKRSVESARIGQTHTVVFHAQMLGAPSIYQQMSAMMVPKVITVDCSGMSEQDMQNHMSQLVDLIRTNPWMNGCFDRIEWEENKILFTNGMEVLYR